MAATLARRVQSTSLTISLATLWRIAALTLVVVLVTGSLGLRELKFDSHYTAYLDSADQRLIDHQALSQIYSRHDELFVVLQSDVSFLEAQNFRLLEDLSDSLTDRPAVVSVRSIAQLGIAGETMTDDGYLIPSREQLQNQSRAMGLLLAEDTKVAGILVQVDLANGDARAVLDTVRNVRDIVETRVGEQPVTVHYTGTLALNEAYIQVVRQDLSRFLPLLLLVMIVVLRLLLRSFSAVITILPVGICAVIAAFGIAGLFGATLAAINAFVPIIIVSIGVAGCVHMVSSYNHYRDTGQDPQSAALAATRYNLLPMALANGTTALGFLGLALSPSPPVRVVGYLVATGIVVSFLLCVTLLPVLLARFDPRATVREALSTPMQWVTRFVARRRNAIVVFFLLIALPAAWFASRNVISDNVLTYFAESHAFSQDSRLVEERLSGTNEVLYSIDSGSAQGIFNAKAVESVYAMAAWLRQQPEVGRVVSIADAPVLKEAMQEGRLQQRLDFYKDRVELSNERNPSLALEVSPDFSSSVLSVYLKQLSSAELIRFDASVHSWAADNIGEYSVQSGGPALMFAHLGETNIRGMLTALVIALFVAAILLGAMLRSARIAWVGLVCNLMPVLLVYSIWAVADGHISIGAAVVMGMILGIVLDDTIYLLIAWRRGRERGLANPVSYAIHRVGPALLVTTVTLVAGLSLGLLSEFGPIWNMSALSVAIIGMALVVDLLLLPALLPAAEHPEARS